MAQHGQQGHGQYGSEWTTRARSVPLSIYSRSTVSTRNVKRDNDGLLDLVTDSNYHKFVIFCGSYAPKIGAK